MKRTIMYDIPEGEERTTASNRIFWLAGRCKIIVDGQRRGPASSASKVERLQKMVAA
jgi:hypothetical protein